MSKIVDFRLSFDEDLEGYLKKKYSQYLDYRVLSKALDARGANRGKDPSYNYKIELAFKNDPFVNYEEDISKIKAAVDKPIIIGAGPAGLFCALRLSEFGISSIVIERGERATQRMKKIARFWRYGEFDEENNVCFGEGGAGLFSDGKLITRIKSPYVKYVMQRFVDFGAPPETAYTSNPHLGSNKIRALITKMTDHLKEQGCSFHYNSRVEELLMEGSRCVGVKTHDGKTYKSSNIVLATGHSSKEMYKHINECSVAMKAKDFAVGVRIEHPRREIDSIQYGEFASKELGAARYKLTYHNKESNKGTYSFCMCPGGYVLSSGTDYDGIVVNGMSNYSRSSPWSNSALVVSIKAGVDFSTDDVLNGHFYQKSIENKAYEYSKSAASGKEIPSQNLKDFLENKTTKTLNKTSCPSGIFASNLREILPATVVKGLIEGLGSFDQKLDGFISEKSLLLAPETRTSAPVTILRDKNSLESQSHEALFPCGEGAGYAGGITSAAVDGVRVAMEIIRRNS